MTRYGSKNDPRMIYQQNLSARMFVSHKLQENARINFLQSGNFFRRSRHKKIQFVL